MGDTESDQVWKRTTRQSAIEQRAQMDPELKRSRDAALNQRLEAALLDSLSQGVIGFCWPYKGEFDLRFVVRKLRERGAAAALPVVVKKGRPMIFRKWWPGVPMVPGAFAIPVPADTPQCEPDSVFAPINAFDDAGFRLGYGGGFFDRTLASITPQPIAIGIAYEEQRLESIRPNQYDIPMDFIFTEAKIYRRVGEHLEAVAPEECSAAIAELMVQRGLPRQQASSAQ